MSLQTAHIHRRDQSLPLPEYQTPGSVAFDLYARVDTTVAPGELVKVPTNFIIATPPGHALLLFARSSLFQKKHLILGNSVGVIDQDYSGTEDEILVSVYNIGTTPAHIARGERFAQGMFVPIAKATWRETNPAEKSRGGFGSTG